VGIVVDNPVDLHFPCGSFATACFCFPQSGCEGSIEKIRMPSLPQGCVDRVGIFTDGWLRKKTGSTFSASLAAIHVHP
jgi:hypothetical protein